MTEKRHEILVGKPWPALLRIRCRSLQNRSQHEKENQGLVREILLRNKFRQLPHNIPLHRLTLLGDAVALEVRHCQTAGHYVEGQRPFRSDSWL